MARCGWLVAMAVGLLCGPSRWSVAQNVDDEPVERADPVVAAPASRPTTRVARRPTTRLSASNRQPSKPTSRPVTFDIKPSTVTIRLKEARADEVFSELSKQSGGAVFELSPDLWPDTIPPVGRVQIVNQPFWPALREVLRLSGARLVTPPSSLATPVGSRETGVLTIAPRRGDDDEGINGVVSGPVLVSATSVTRTAQVDMAEPAQVKRTALLQLQVLLEPKFNAVPLEPAVRVERGEDERGRAIEAVAWPGPRPPGAPATISSMRAMGPPGRVRVPLRLALPAADTRRAAKLSGTVEFATMTRGVEIEVPDVMNVSGTAMRLPGGVQVLIDEVTTQGNQLTFRFVAWSDGRVDPKRWDLIRRGFAGWARRARIVAEDGTPVPETMSTWSPGSALHADVVEFRMSLHLPPVQGGRYRLLWTAPAEATVLAVPFELTDVPLP